MARVLCWPKPELHSCLENSAWTSIHRPMDNHAGIFQGCRAALKSKGSWSRGGKFANKRFTFFFCHHFFFFTQWSSVVTPASLLEILTFSTCLDYHCNQDRK